MELVNWQLSFGCRYPGADGHYRFRTALTEDLQHRFSDTIIQRFSLKLRSRQSPCSNIIVRVPACTPPLGETAGKGPLLLGTHFDTRLTADQEEDEALRSRPILGANDGGSGTAVLLHLAERLKELDLKRDVYLAFFDAEDVGDIDGYPFSVGAAIYAAKPIPAAPQEVIILDMVGGKGLILNVDKHIYRYPPSRALTERIWHLARVRGIHPVYRQKRSKLKYIICDHTPFQIRGYPTCVLIDIDYPEWHTHRDVPDAMSGESLALIEDLLLAYLTDELMDAARTT
jgi:glutaminyl-peptide cyclotransferase